MDAQATAGEMHPARRTVVLLSFEGPDRYSLIGGLGTRVTELAAALGADGSHATLIFVGDPDLPAVETPAPGVEYRRWCQWLSHYHRADVYDNEDAKIADYAASAPPFIVDTIVAPAIERGERVTVIAEEFQTAPAVIRLDALLRERGLREHVVLTWNANNTYGFDHRIDWGALRFAAAITAVSKYMKFELWIRGIDALVIPNGIPDRLLAHGPDNDLVAGLRIALPHHPLLLKVGRFDPDKRWLPAIDAVAAMREAGVPARLIMRGGREPYGEEVRAHARWHGLTLAEVRSDSRADDALIPLLGDADADVVEIRSFVPEPLLHALYAHADATLANSGKEPFGLVGLEVMASGGLAVCGSTGEDYADPFVNALVVDTPDGRELATYLRTLLGDPAATRAMRSAGHATAARYAWSEVLKTLDRKLAAIEAMRLTR